MVEMLDKIHTLYFLVNVFIEYLLFESTKRKDIHKLLGTGLKTHPVHNSTNFTKNT